MGEYVSECMCFCVVLIQRYGISMIEYGENVVGWFIVDVQNVLMGMWKWVEWIDVDVLHCWNYDIKEIDRSKLYIL